MDVGKDIGRILGSIVLGIIIIVAMIYLMIGVGYFFGMVIVILPFVSDWLTEELPISTDQIPGIMAWIIVVGAFFGVGTRRKTDE